MLERPYYTLLGSLPALPRQLDKADRLPISRLRLQQRLSMLEPEDAATIETLAGFLAWDRQPLDRTDEEVVARYDQLRETVRNPSVWSVIEVRMQVRTIISALRRRRRDEGPPPGVGPLAIHIARQWKRPDFGLTHRFPWVGTLDRMLDQGAIGDSERLILGLIWTQWNRLSDQQTFSFEAVILYLARWEILSRWIGRDEDAGRQKFETLVSEAMGEYARIYP